ncbi:MAG: hypothetical protein ACPIC4_06850 [Candidatus Puniceispirillaceae bacterium]
MATSDVVTLPKTDSQSYSALRLDARKLNIYENWQMPMEPPYIEHTLSPNPSSLIVDWASQVLLPVAGSGEVVLDIQQASVKVVELTKGSKLLDVFRDQQAYKVEVEIEADLMWIQPVGSKNALVELSAAATETIEESATPNMHEMAIRQTVVKAIDALDVLAREKIAEIDGMTRP